MRNRLGMQSASIVVFLFLGNPGLLAQGPDHNRFRFRPEIAPGTHTQVLVPSPAPTRGTPPGVGPNTQVNALQLPLPNSLIGRSETTVATSSDGTLVLAGFNDAQGFCGPPFGAPCTPESPPGISGYAFSADGGLTWTDAGAPDPALSPGGNVFTRGDPWMDRGGLDNRTFYYSNLAVDMFTGADLGMSVHRGHFVGASFAFEDVHVLSPPSPNNFYDKNAFAAAKDGSGAAYATITDFIEVCGVPAGGFGQIELWRTHDAGDSWQGPSIVSPNMTFITDPTNPACGLTGTVQQGAVPAIGPKGEVYVAWLQGPTFTGPAGSTESTSALIQVARSLDGGVTFGSPVTVATINTSFARTDPAGFNRLGGRLDSPRIAVATAGANLGRVYVTFTSEVAPAPIPGPVACPSGLPANSVCLGQDPLSEEAFISFSDDRGLTWSTPALLATPVPSTGVKRMWPVVSVEPGGNVDVVYYQSQEAPTTANPECVVNLDSTLIFPIGGLIYWRVGPRNSLVDTFWVQSVNGGKTFGAPVTVTNVTTNWCTTYSDIFPNFGDYIGSTSAGNRVFPIWSDGRNGVPDTFFAPVLGTGKGP